MEDYLLPLSLFAEKSNLYLHNEKMNFIINTEASMDSMPVLMTKLHCLKFPSVATYCYMFKTQPVNINMHLNVDILLATDLIKS